ncbi:cation:proton antiporter [Magnetospirillum sulfuroxidans]|uniref:Cation:proton antiporter n=1 Tax=Magnetospirillum sulfuroxidans TaxID=611300 RepID=A0ABS5IC22_9PROT|nr:cation:proton antiporter [Magnetospirillum sulfuroxidans]
MHHGIILDLLIFLAIAVVVSPVCHRLRISPVLGYLLAGSVAGPVGLGLIADNDGTRSLAELGIIFLLFMIGLELSWDRLRVIRRFIFGLGSAQVLASGLAAAAVLGVLVPALPFKGAVVVGLALAFSSTAFILQILSERGGLTSQTGRVAVAVLILQDLAVVPLLVMIPLLGSNADSGEMVLGMAAALSKAALAMAVIFVLARLALRPLFQVVAATRSPEVFVAAALFAVIGTSFATESVGLSHSLGAFLAGVMLASTEFRHQVEADILPIRGLLMGLFFLTVGMTIAPAALLNDLPRTAIGVGLLLVLKASILAMLALAFRFSLSTALHLGVLLAQGGEFAFIVLARAQQNALLDVGSAELITGIVAISMALTPVLALIGEWIARHQRLHSGPLIQPGDETKDLANHVIIAGCGRAGQIVLSILREQGIPYVGIEREPLLVETLRKRDEPVFFGDIRKLEVLKAVGGDRARAVVLTIDSGSSREKLVPRLHALFPDLRILVRARDRRQAKGLEISGAAVVVPEILEGSLQLSGHVLRQLGKPPEEVQALLEEYRKDDYAKLALTHEKD